MLIHRSRSPRKGLLVAALLVVTSLAVAASAQATTLPTLTLTVSKTAITVGGATQSGGVNIVSSAPGIKEANTVLFLLKPGITEAEVETGLKESKKDPNRTVKYGTIVFDQEAPASGMAEAQTNLQAGRYLALAGEGEGGKKQHTFFTVTAAAAPAALPTPEATVRSIEFGFRGPKVLHDGELVRFENEGFLIHMDIAFRAKTKADAYRIVSDLRTGHEKGVEKLVAGEPFTFAGPISHEAFMQETITAKPGWYVQACFMETQDGRDHTRLGMERIIQIVK